MTSFWPVTPPPIPGPFLSEAAAISIETCISGSERNVCQVRLNNVRHLWAAMAGLFRIIIQQQDGGVIESQSVLI